MPIFASAVAGIEKGNTMKKFLFGLVMLMSFQGHSQTDTLFWFAAPWVTPDHDGNVQFAFRISTLSGMTSVRIQMPASTYDTSFVVPPNSLASIDLSHLVNQIESKPANQTLSSGIKITSDEMITVVYDFISDLVTISPGNGANPETYSLKGQNGMGTEFLLPFQTLWDNKHLNDDKNGDGFITQPYQQACIVATEDNTTILITPKCAVVGGHPPNIPYSYTLDKGEVYTIQNLSQSSSISGNNLSGTIVSSDKPVAVTVADDSVNPSGGGGCYDILGDQIVPITLVGNNYIVNQGFLNAGSNESIFILPLEDSTTIDIDDGVMLISALSHYATTYQYSITAPLTSVKANKPVYVFHMTGYGCELGAAILPPTNCAESDQVVFSRNNDHAFSLHIVCPSGAQGDFTLTGPGSGSVTAGAFQVVPGTGGAWVGAQINFDTTEIFPGSANLIKNSSDVFKLGIINGGNNSGCLYHYLSEFSNTNSVSVTYDFQTACDSFTWVDGNTYTTNNNTATYTFTSFLGCDSLVALYLTIINSASGTDTQSACDSFTWIDGNTYNSSNNSATYTISGGASNGCDSVVTLNLTINSIDASIIAVNDTSLLASQPGATYQWLDCDNGFSIIPGENDQSFTASVNGNYAVEITQNNCVDTSACFSIINAGIIENSFGKSLLVYPNPTDGSFIIDLGLNYEAISVSITDLNGKEIQSNKYNNSELLNLEIHEPVGVYLLIIESGEKKAVIRLVKE